MSGYLMKNGVRYSTMMRARSDSQDHEWSVLNTNTGKLCKSYILENETLKHFFINMYKIKRF